MNDELPHKEAAELPDINAVRAFGPETGAMLFGPDYDGDVMSKLSLGAEMHSRGSFRILQKQWKRGILSLVRKEMVIFSDTDKSIRTRYSDLSLAVRKTVMAEMGAIERMPDAQGIFLVCIPGI